MAKRCNLTTIPDRVYELIEQDGRSREESVPQTITRIVCDHYLSNPTQVGHKLDISSTQIRHKADKLEKFEPPSREEAEEWHGLKVYHFDLEEWFAYYEARGWIPKGSKGATKSWKALMVTFEANWKKQAVSGGGDDGQGRRVSAADQRVAEARRNIIDGIRDAVRDRDRSNGAQLEMQARKVLGH